MQEHNVRQNSFDFVGLERANQVPSDISRQMRLFREQLLHPILSK